MKRALTVTALVAMGLLVATSFAAAQDAPAKTSGGQIVIGALGVEDVASSKFQEYREVPKGISVPYVRLFAEKGNVAFNLDAFNVRQSDQRYTGWLNVGWLGVSFDYNQIPHNMGNGGLSIYAESAPGVWRLSDTLQQALQTANDTQLPTTTRTYAFYSNLLAPTFASAGRVDISSLRQRGSYEVDLFENRAFDLVFSYIRELKSGYRGLGGGNIRGSVNPSFEVANPLDELMQDYGVRAAYNFKAGNIYAAFNRNLYNNRAETLTLDNPFQAIDALVTPAAGAVPILGGPSRDHIVMAPDNEASTGTAGFLLKFARQTRIAGGLALATRTQDASFYPYTSNTAVLTPTGTLASSLAALPQPSFNGKVSTAMWNVTFSSRPVRGLGLRAQYRTYDLTDKSGRWVSTGDMSVPHQNWNTVTPSAAAPYGRPTASPYETKTSRFNASVSYDFGDLTVEGSFRDAQFERTYREAETGEETGVAFAAIYRASDWLKLIAKYDDASRTAEGHTVYGFQSDEAERDTTRTAIQVELTPVDALGLTFAYGKRDVEYPNRPDRIQVTGGLPVAGAQPIPGTPSGLLEAKYDTYTAQIDFSPHERVEVGAYYTYEKDASLVTWHTTTGAALNNSLAYDGSDKTDTFGANAVFHLVPEKWTFTFTAMHQKVDGLMDITAREAGSFYTPGRTTLIPAGQGGAADITDWDDTELTTVTARLDYAFAEVWKLGFGYWYEKYDFKDAFNTTDNPMPLNVYIFMKPNDGAYTANVVFATLTYRF